MADRYGELPLTLGGLALRLAQGQRFICNGTYMNGGPYTMALWYDQQQERFIVLFGETEHRFKALETAVFVVLYGIGEFTE